MVRSSSLIMLAAAAMATFAAGHPVIVPDLAEKHKFPRDHVPPGMTLEKFREWHEWIKDHPLANKAAMEAFTKPLFKLYNNTEYKWPLPSHAPFNASRFPNEPLTSIPAALAGEDDPILDRNGQAYNNSLTILIDQRRAPHGFDPYMYVGPRKVKIVVGGEKALAHCLLDLNCDAHTDTDRDGWVTYNTDGRDIPCLGPHELGIRASNFCKDTGEQKADQFEHLSFRYSVFSQTLNVGDGDCVITDVDGNSTSNRAAKCVFGTTLRSWTPEEGFMGDTPQWKITPSNWDKYGGIGQPPVDAPPFHTTVPLK